MGWLLTASHRFHEALIADDRLRDIPNISGYLYIKWTPDSNMTRIVLKESTYF